MASADRIRLALPFDRAALARLEAGDSCCSPALCTRCAMRGTCASWPSWKPPAARCPTVWTVRPSSMRVPRPKRPGAGLRRGRAHHGQPHGFRRPRAAPRRRRGDGGQGPPLVRGARCLPRDGFRLFRGMRRGRGLSGEVRGIIGDGGVRRSGNRGPAPHRRGRFPRLRRRRRQGPRRVRPRLARARFQRDGGTTIPVIHESAQATDALRGIFITFEGGEGAGKTTHIRFLSETRASARPRGAVPARARRHRGGRAIARRGVGPGERRHVRRGRAAHLRGRPRAADGAGHRARAGARGRGAVRPFHRFDGGLPGLREGLAAHVRRPRERVRLPGRASRPHHPHGHGRRRERGPRARDASGGGRPPRAGGRGVPCPRERGVSGNRPARPRARARGGRPTATSRGRRRSCSPSWPTCSPGWRRSSTTTRRFRPPRRGGVRSARRLGPSRRQQRQQPWQRRHPQRRRGRREGEGRQPRQPRSESRPQRRRSGQAGEALAGLERRGRKRSKVEA